MLQQVLSCVSCASHSHLSGIPWGNEKEFSDNRSIPKCSRWYVTTKRGFLLHFFMFLERRSALNSPVVLIGQFQLHFLFYSIKTGINPLENCLAEGLVTHSTKHDYCVQVHNGMQVSKGSCPWDIWSPATHAEGSQFNPQHLQLGQRGKKAILKPFKVTASLWAHIGIAEQVCPCNASCAMPNST